MKLLQYKILILLFLLGLTGKAQVQLSSKAEIAIVTLGPYQGEPWSAFGHNGFRVVDAANGVDWFYDYGLYDFKQENFFLNFAKGLLKYKVGVRKWSRSFRYQKRLNRTIKLQYLNLTLAEKQQLFDFLQFNARPENAEYLYHYVFDNCATKIRDVMEEQFPHRISLDMSYKQEGKTIRGLMNDYLGQQAWGDFGIDLGLGMEVDREATAREYMFLPPYIYKAFAGASIERNGAEVPLVIKSVDAFIPEKESTMSVAITPTNFFIVLFFIAGLITHRNMKAGTYTKWIDFVLFGFAGFLGWWAVYLWAGTEHMSKYNLNLLWAIPSHLPLIFLVGRYRLSRFFKYYFKVVGILYAILLLLWALLPQPLHVALVPLVLAMCLRSFYASYYLGSIKKVNG